MRRVALLLLLAGCSTQQAPPRTVAQVSAESTSVPPYANHRYEPFSRTTTVAIALREWRAFGQGVNDGDPLSLPDPLRPDRQAGLWQRVGDYWFGSQEPGSRAASWSGKYDENGVAYPDRDYSHAWSAAFISYVMRLSGAGDRFLYSPLHADYINAAAQGLYDMRAFAPEATVLMPGDLICLGRGRSADLHFADLPAAPFPGHCDLVVDALPGRATVVGGNVDGSVTMKHIPTTADGRLAGGDGVVVDTRYPWMAVLRVKYEL